VHRACGDVLRIRHPQCITLPGPLRTPWSRFKRRAPSGSSQARKTTPWASRRPMAPTVYATVIEVGTRACRCGGSTMRLQACVRCITLFAPKITLVSSNSLAARCSLLDWRVHFSRCRREQRRAKTSSVCCCQNDPRTDRGSQRSGREQNFLAVVPDP